MERSKSIASRGIRSRRNNRQRVCRVCLKKAKGMVNIFDSTPELGVSIADMISECTGFHVFKGDSFPETICPPCLQDARNAFEIKQTYEGSHQFFLQLNQDSEEHKDVLGEENCVQGIEFQVKKEGIEHLLEESAPQMEYFQIDEYLPDEVEDGPFVEYLPGKVVNEPIEEDPLEENLDYDIDSSYLQGNSAGIDSHDNEYEQCRNLCTGNGDDITNAAEIPFHRSSCPRLFQAHGIDPSYLQGNSAGTDTHNDEYEQCPNLCTGNGDVINNAEKIPFKCSSCPRLFQTLGQLKMHNYTHAEPTYKCDYCEQAFVHQFALTKHVRTHTGERPFKCFICQQDFQTQQKFSIHFKSHPLNSLFKCSHCELAYTSKEELDQHFKTHALYNCSQCKRVFQSQRQLKNHVRSAHIKKTSPPERSFKCSHCDKSFAKNQALTLHMKYRHHEKSLKCSYCKGAFHRHQDLALHLKKYHL